MLAAHNASATITDDDEGQETTSKWGGPIDISAAAVNKKTPIVVFQKGLHSHEGSFRFQAVEATDDTMPVWIRFPEMTVYDPYSFGAIAQPSRTNYREINRFVQQHCYTKSAST